MEFKTGKNRFYQIDKRGDVIAEITYVEAGETTLIIDSTYVATEYRGQKIAEQLVLKVIDKAEKEEKKIIPLCSYAKSFFEKHKVYDHLLKK